MERHPSRQSFDCEGTAFSGNDVLTCRVIAVGQEGLTLLAPCARRAGEFVRLQSHLTPGHWLDTDAVIEDCRIDSGHWVWSLRFVNVAADQRALLDDLLKNRTMAPPRPAPQAERAKRTSGMQRRVDPDRASLAELYKEALSEVKKAEKARHALVGADDTVWQARNWGRKSG